MCSRVGLRQAERPRPCLVWSLLAALSFAPVLWCELAAASFYRRSVHEPELLRSVGMEHARNHPANDGPSAPEQNCVQLAEGWIWSSPGR
jgi:hypothetical protein